MAQAFSSSLQLDTAPLATVLRQTGADSWAPGMADASAQMGLPRAPMTDWTPGNPPNPDELGGDFTQFLEEQGTRIKGIDETTRHDIGEALERGLANGTPVKEIARDIDQVLGDPKRAMLIARTETNRAMTQASLATYRRNEIGEWDLLTMPGACPVCEAIRATNPHSVADTIELPPEHPNCRCSIAPAINAGG